MANIVVKKGDSISWKVKYKQSDNITPVDLTGFSIDVDAYNRTNKALLFNILSGTPTSNMWITTDRLHLGEFSIVVKDTSGFTLGDYSIDIEYRDVDGFTKSSKSFGLRLVERL